jgi:hypothetical protein
MKKVEITYHWPRAMKKKKENINLKELKTKCGIIK